MPRSSQVSANYFAVIFKKLIVKTNLVILLLLASVIVFSILNPIFISSTNISNLSTQVVFLLLITVGQMLVLITGGFDLSVGAVTALTSITSAMVMASVSNGGTENVALAITLGLLAALGIGLICGIINGVTVSLLKVNPFIATLATASIFQGATLLLSSGQQISGIPMSFVIGFGSGDVFGIPALLIAAIPAILIVAFFVIFQPYGKALYAIGGNEKAAHVTGIPITKYVSLTYLTCSVLTAFGAWLLTARVSAGQPLLGSAFPLESITAAIIGGASLRGGRGGIGGAIGGAIFVVMLSNGMDLARLGSNWQMVTLGVVLIASVIIDVKKEQWRKQVF
ncbi:ABC transporter permease [Castellaniella sp.]|uniref:ABC transporter permease n=1 Tax=Castellaniella sp. TaxID=1955812 RepID=UPI00356B3F89